jgi:hypothetical protein
MEKRWRGRPRKTDDRMKPREFSRLVKVCALYDELRGKGEKQSVAVSEVIANLKQERPKLRISQGGVRGILSKHRSRGSGIIVCFERVALGEEDIKRYRWMRALVHAPQEKMGMTLAELPVYGEKRPREKFLIRFSERPDYPRYNRKAPKE